MGTERQQSPPTPRRRGTARADAARAGPWPKRKRRWCCAPRRSRSARRRAPPAGFGASLPEPPPPPGPRGPRQCAQGARADARAAPVKRQFGRGAAARGRARGAAPATMCWGRAPSRARRSPPRLTAAYGTAGRQRPQRPRRSAPGNPACGCRRSPRAPPCSPGCRPLDPKGRCSRAGRAARAPLRPCGAPWLAESGQGPRAAPRARNFLGASWGLNIVDRRKNIHAHET